ncbi:UNVERIFIED_CONTAM: hypothetical protein HDU68_012464, partial [Siphonaria sp. JEL0065]
VAKSTTSGAPAGNVPSSYVAPAPTTTKAPAGNVPTTAAAYVAPAPVSATSKAPAGNVPTTVAAYVAPTPAKTTPPAAVKPSVAPEDDCEEVEEDCEEVEEDCEDDVPAKTTPPKATPPAGNAPTTAYVPAYTANQIKAAGIGSGAIKTGSAILAGVVAFFFAM